MVDDNGNVFSSTIPFSPVKNTDDKTTTARYILVCCIFAKFPCDLFPGNPLAKLFRFDALNVVSQT